MFVFNLLQKYAEYARQYFKTRLYYFAFSSLFKFKANHLRKATTIIQVTSEQIRRTQQSWVPESRETSPTIWNICQALPLWPWNFTFSHRQISSIRNAARHVALLALLAAPSASASASAAAFLAFAFLLGRQGQQKTCESGFTVHSGELQVCVCVCVGREVHSGLGGCSTGRRMQQVNLLLSPPKWNTKRRH